MNWDKFWDNFWVTLAGLIILGWIAFWGFIIWCIYQLVSWVITK